MKVDCAAIPVESFEREFFGAASTDASTGEARGRLEAADRGTLFLDHVAELPAVLQAKLARPLQDSTFERVGESHPRRADVRFLAATDRDLAEQVSQGHFRQDLFFRLSVFPIEVPPLRARAEDIPVLIAHFLAPLEVSLSDEQVEHLQMYDWPGNVRELKNVVERARILSGTGPLQFDAALPASKLSYTARGPLTEEQAPARGYYTATELEQLERSNLVAAMEAASWRVSGGEGAAARLGLTVSKCRSRLRAHGVERPAPDSLYVRLGGSRGIAALARDLVGRAIANPQIGRFWHGRSTYGVLREERLLVSYLSSATGGPAQYAGRDMASGHRHLGITAADWGVFRGVLNETLEALRIADTERREVVDFVETLKADIVQG